MQNIENLTEKEKEYFYTEGQTISVPAIIGKYIIGIFLLALSSFISPSAEGKLPFSSYFVTLRNRIKFTKYRNAVINKLNGNNDKKNKQILIKVNSENFALDNTIDTKNEDKTIEEIYNDYLKEHQNDSK